MTEDITKRLQSLGYTLKDGDAWPLRFITDKIETEIKTKTNQKEVPDDLAYMVVDRICGTFLLEKKNMGQLDEMEQNAIVTGISEGDTNISFAAGATPEQMLDAAMTRLMRDDGSILKHRKLVFR